MRKLLAFGCLVVFAHNVYADASGGRDFYIRAESGVVIPVAKVGSDSSPFNKDTRFKTTALYGGGLGYKFTDFFRSEIEFQYRNMNYKSRQKPVPGITTGDYIKQNTKNWNFFWNGYLEAKNQSIFTPYITAGIGYARLLTGMAYCSSIMPGNWAYPGKSTNNFAWNAGIGSKIKLSDAFDFDIATRYIALGKIGFDNSVGTMLGIPGKPVKIENLEVSMGLSYNF